jgi:hypothetical protein
MLEILLLIREVLASNHSMETDHIIVFLHCFPMTLQENAGIIFLTGHDLSFHVFPNSYFTVIPSALYCVTYTTVKASLNKQ